jgi:non-ribosomal peptide synthetase component F
VSGGTPRLLHDFFESQVALQPDQPAVECKGEALTYAQLDRLANSMAASLQARGIGVGSLVGIYLEKSCGLFAAILGVLKAGAGYVPLDPSFPIGRVQSILEDADIRIVISGGALAETLTFGVACDVMILRDELRHTPQSSMVRRPEMGSPNDICYVIYTSGSTGRPKGVVIEHRHAVNFVQSLRTIYKLTPEDRVYQGFSVAFDASIEEIWAAFSIGGTLVVPERAISRSAVDAADFINLHRITYFSTVPSFLALIRNDLPGVRLLVVGGEACSAELVHRRVTPKRRMLTPTVRPRRRSSPRQSIVSRANRSPSAPSCRAMLSMFLTSRCARSRQEARANFISAAPALRAAI